jgi:hypothetical protein
MSVSHRSTQKRCRTLVILLIKQDGTIRQEKIVSVRFVPMVDKRGKTY